MLADAQRAIQWVRYYADELDISPDKIATCGFSAGGHLSVMVAQHDSEENLMDRKKKSTLSTTQIILLSFLVTILVGSVFLALPISSADGEAVSYLDALFTATSSVCVTGLSTVNVATTFSTDGLIIIALLIQIGGLGVMTITSFFALFFMGHTTLYDQFALRDMVGSDAFSSLMSTLLYILGFTLGIEAIGAFFIWTTIHGDLGMGLRDEILFSVFHAISSFCNAGFSTLNGNLGNPMLIQGHGSFYIIISMLILLGSIGFPILVNFKNVIFYIS